MSKFQPEADAPDGFDAVAADVACQLAAQVADMLPEGALGAVRRIGADAVEEHGPGQDLAGVLQQQL